VASGPRETGSKTFRARGQGQKAGKFTGRQAGSATKDQVGKERRKVLHGCSRTIWQGCECWRGLYAVLIGNELQLSLQVSVVGLIREEWLADRLEQRQGEWKITEAEG